MNKHKFILAIILMISLIILLIVMPTIWEHRSADSIKTLTASKSDTTEESNTQLLFHQFDALNGFFTDIQITSLKEQFPIYFERTNHSDISYVVFMPDETSYLNPSDVLLIFRLSDGSTFPITYDTSTGVFLLGKEEMKLKTDTVIYEQPTYHGSSDFSEEALRNRQEGGYPDTDSTNTQPDTNTQRKEAQ